MALENAAEVVRVGEAEHFGNFMDGQLRALQQVFGAADTIMIEILDRRFAGLFFKYFVHVPRGEVDQVGKLRFAADGGVIVVDVGADFADVGRIRARGFLLGCRVQREQPAQPGEHIVMVVLPDVVGTGEQLGKMLCA